MKRTILHLSKSLNSIILIMFLMLFAPHAFSQTPTHTPRNQPEPVGFLDSWENVIFYVIIPVLIVILYFLWKRDVAKRRKKESGESS